MKISSFLVYQPVSMDGRVQMGFLNKDFDMELIDGLIILTSKKTGQQKGITLSNVPEFTVDRSVEVEVKKVIRRIKTSADVNIEPIQTC